jgi:hypothetical protein
MGFLQLFFQLQEEELIMLVWLKIVIEKVDFILVELAAASFD